MDLNELIARMNENHEALLAEREYRAIENRRTEELESRPEYVPFDANDYYREYYEKNKEHMREYNRNYMKQYRQKKSNLEYQRKYQHEYKKSHKSIRNQSRQLARRLGLKLDSNWQLHHIFGNEVIDSFVVLRTKKHYELHSIFGEKNPCNDAESKKQIQWVHENCNEYFVVKNGKLL